MHDLADHDAVEAVLDSNVLHIALNRPEMHNALNPDMISALTTLFLEVAHNESVRVVVLTGNGRSFCAGADLGSMRAAADIVYDQNIASAEAIFDLMQAVDQCPKPVIGRINGAAIGGGIGLVSCCDITIAVDSAKFGFSETRLGLVPAVISPFVISKIGEGNGRQLFLTGERFDAFYAREIGLIQHLVPAEELDTKVNERIRQLLLAAPGAQAAAKALIHTVGRQPKSASRSFTAQMIADRRASAEGKEGMSAFLEKRKPRWRIEP
ncbi:MAG: enoyl-CoA hydratase-related protein [Candidatus Promineifilaceae bacterium]|nr:enoyl-CoA hydratase-related protein [Candidatus Promineifilaceae bacterium]